MVVFKISIPVGEKYRGFFHETVGNSSVFLGSDEHADVVTATMEALENVFQHSKAQSCDLEISIYERLITVTVSDDGYGRFHVPCVSKRCALVRLRAMVEKGHGRGLLLMLIYSHRLKIKGHTIEMEWDRKVPNDQTVEIAIAV